MKSATCAPTLAPEAGLHVRTQTYVEHGRISAELHQVLAQFTLVLIQHVWRKTHAHFEKGMVWKMCSKMR